MLRLFKSSHVVEAPNCAHKVYTKSKFCGVDAQVDIKGLQDVKAASDILTGNGKAAEVPDGTMIFAAYLAGVAPLVPASPCGPAVPVAPVFPTGPIGPIGPWGPVGSLTALQLHVPVQLHI